MLRKSLITLTIVVAITLLGVAPASPVSAQNAPPVYQLQYLGPGSPVAISNTGIVVGRSISSAQTATALTGSNGRARFTVTGARGTYTLTVTNVTKGGYVFDAAGSVLSKSITK